MECPQNCHGNGDCLSGICHCFPGFLGPDCSRGKCTHTKTLCHPRSARNCSKVVIPAVAVTCATRWRFKCPVYSQCALCLGSVHKSGGCSHFYCSCCDGYEKTFSYNSTKLCQNPTFPGAIILYSTTIFVFNNNKQHNQFYDK